MARVPGDSPSCDTGTGSHGVADGSPEAANSTAAHHTSIAEPSAQKAKRGDPRRDEPGGRSTYEVRLRAGYPRLRGLGAVRPAALIPEREASGNAREPTA